MKDFLTFAGAILIVIGFVAIFGLVAMVGNCQQQYRDTACGFVALLGVGPAFSIAAMAWFGGILLIALGHVVRVLENIRDSVRRPAEPLPEPAPRNDRTPTLGRPATYTPTQRDPGGV